MPVSNEVPIKEHPYAGIGSYSASYIVYSTDSITVTVIDELGVERQLVYLVDYTVTIIPEDGGVTVTLILDSYPNASLLYIKRIEPLEQTSEWDNGSSLDLRLLTRTFDRVVMMIQQINASVETDTVAVNWRGDWATGIVFNQNDIARAPSGNWYVSTSQHTSGVFATDLSAGKWLLAIDIADIGGVNIPDPSTGAEGQAIVVNATLDGYELGDAGGGIKWSVKTVNSDTEAGEGFLVDTSAAAKTITLHSSPEVGDTVAVGDYAGTFGTYACTIARNSMLINSVAADLVLNANGEVMTLVYSGATKGWVTVGTVTADYPKTVLNKPFFHCQDQKAYNVDGGTNIADAWTKRTLNTVIYNDIQGASLASDQVSLPAGVYYVEGSAQHRCGGTALNAIVAIFIDSIKAVQGQSNYLGTSSTEEVGVSGVITLSNPAVVSLKYYAGLAQATDGLGVSNNVGSITDASINSIYADLKIWQLDRSLEVAPKAVNSGLQTIAGMNTEGNIMGFDVTVSGNTLTITKGSCMSSDLTVPLAFTTDKTCVLPGTVNGDFYVFAVRLLDGVTYEARAYSTYAGPASDAQIDKWRFISFAKNNGSGVTMPYRQMGDRIDWTVATNRPILTATTPTTYTTDHNINAVLPNSIFKFEELAAVGGFSCKISYDGGATSAVGGYPGDSGPSPHIPVVIPSTPSVRIASSNGSLAVYFTSATLRR